jgi:hypothetical protein
VSAVPLLLPLCLPFFTLTSHSLFILVLVLFFRIGLGRFARPRFVSAALAARRGAFTVTLRPTIRIWIFTLSFFFTLYLYIQ